MGFDERDSWARLRFAIIGPLLAAPPERGALRQALRELAARRWRHPDTGEDVSFGVSTLVIDRPNGATHVRRNGATHGR